MNANQSSGAKIKLTRTEGGFWLYVEAGGVGSGYPLSVDEAKKLQKRLNIWLKEGR